MRHPAFKLVQFFESLEILAKIGKNHGKSQICYFEKEVLKLCRAAMIKPRQIECSGFFLLDHNGQSRVYILVSGQPDEWLWRKHDFPMKDDDCPPPTVGQNHGAQYLN